MVNRWIVGVVALVVVGGALLVAAGRLGGSPPTETPTPFLSPPRGRTVTAEGSIAPARYARMGFKVSGKLQELLVQEGDEVKEGQPLARLDRKELELGVVAAQKALALAQAQLAQLQAAPRTEQVALARAKLRNVEARLAEMEAGATPEQVAAAEAQVRLAKNQLFAVQAQADASIGKPLANYTEAMKEANSGVAWEQIKVAEAKLAELKAGARAEQLTQARVNVEAAQQELALARAPYTPEDLEVARARVEQAKVALEQAQLALENSTLAAPFGGTVVEVLPKPGEVVRATEPAIILADLTELQVKTTDLDEAGASQIKPGQTARITVNAFDNKVVSGRVVSLALRATLTSAGDANFTATIKLERQDPSLRWGMTTKVEFVP